MNNKPKTALLLIAFIYQLTFSVSEATQVFPDEFAFVPQSRDANDAVNLVRVALAPLGFTMEHEPRIRENTILRTFFRSKGGAQVHVMGPVACVTVYIFPVVESELGAPQDRVTIRATIIDYLKAEDAKLFTTRSCTTPL